LPNSKVDLYLDYYEDVPLATTFADANGNWQIQLSPLMKSDGVSVLVPLTNGSHILSTSLLIQSANVGVSGYLLERPAFSDISGVIDNTVFNTDLSPMRNLISHIQFFKSIFSQQPNTVIVFEKPDKNQNLSTTLNGLTIKENSNLVLSDYPDSALFYPIILKAKVQSVFSFVETMENFSNGGLVLGQYNGFDIYALPIGKMTVDNVTENLQEWQMLVSIKTPLLTLLQLSNVGQTFNVMRNAVYRNDYNTLHMVAYGFSKAPQFKNPEIFQDWFEFRNAGWLNNPVYVQKWEKNYILRDQITTNNTGTALINMYKTFDATLVGSFEYNVVVPTPTQAPNIVQEVLMDLSAYADGQYFFVLYVNGNPICISEILELANEWPDTFLVNSKNSKNKDGAFFTTGWSGVLRVNGNIGKWLPSIESIVNEDEAGDFDMAHSLNTRRRTIQTDFIPDYIYLKLFSLLSLDGLTIDGEEYVLSKDATSEPIEKVEGFPLYRFNIDVIKKTNINGNTFDAGTGQFENSVILVVDAGSIGYGGGGLINTELN
jgi:hypothetical protein